MKRTPPASSLVGVPLGLAVVAEGVAAAGPLARDARARRAAGGDDGVRAVGAGAPPRVRVGGEDAPQHEELVQLQQVAVVADQHLDVWKKGLGVDWETEYLELSMEVQVINWALAWAFTLILLTALLRQAEYFCKFEICQQKTVSAGTVHSFAQVHLQSTRLESRVATFTTYLTLPVSVARFLIFTVGVEGLWALRTLDVDPALLQLDLDVDLEAVHARQMGAVPEEREVVHSGGRHAKRALTNLERRFQNHSLTRTKGEVILVESTCRLCVKFTAGGEYEL